jgi:hypothetical protein
MIPAAPATARPDASSRNQTIKMLFDAHYQQDEFLVEAAMLHLVFLDDMRRLQGFIPDGLTPSGGRTD